MDLPNQEVVNPFQSDEIFKNIFKNDKYRGWELKYALRR